MSYAQLHTRSYFNSLATPVQVEVMIRDASAKCTVIGLPEIQIKESVDRVKSAIIAAGFTIPDGNITINLKPATMPKTGSHFDLPIALAILLASQQIQNNCCQTLEVYGELGLDGSVSGSRRLMPLLYHTWQDNKQLLYPRNIEDHVQFLQGITAIPIDNLQQATKCLLQPNSIEKTTTSEIPASATNNVQEFSGIIGQTLNKRALSIAAAGGHHVLLIGPPGTGKSMLANAMHSILPDLSPEAAIESMCFTKSKPTRRPNFRSPHHGITPAGLLGGGSPIKPGEITRAHLGVLFTDELTEYSKQTLEMLREPVENAKITIVRFGESIELPCKFQWLAALNPCPCGMYGHPTEKCYCNTSKRQQYLQKLSAPIIDRFAIGCKVSPIAETSTEFHFSTKDIARARLKQLARANDCNQRLSPEMVQQISLTPKAKQLLKNSEHNLSQRQLQQCLKVARTIADFELGQDEVVADHHLLEAFAFLPRAMISAYH